MKIRTVLIVIAIAGASLPTLGQTNKNNNQPQMIRSLTREELKMARECQKGKPYSLTCNRAHDAGRDDLIRERACAE